MNLADLQPHLATLELTHPGDRKTPLGLTLKLRSLKSDEVQAVIEKHQEEQEREIKAGADSINPAMAKRQGIERIAACVADWEWAEDTDFNGEKLDCTLANVCTVFSTVDDILGETVNFVRREANFYQDFLPGS